MSDKEKKGASGDDDGDCQECAMMKLARGPCSDAFLNAYTCFIRSEEEVKGTDCFDKMNLLTKCWTAFNPDDITGSEKRKQTSQKSSESKTLDVQK